MATPDISGSSENINSTDRDSRLSFLFLRLYLFTYFTFRRVTSLHRKREGIWEHFTMKNATSFYRFDQICFLQNIIYQKVKKSLKIINKICNALSMLSYNYTDIKIEWKSCYEYISNFEFDKKMLVKFMITKYNQCFQKLPVDE